MANQKLTPEIETVLRAARIEGNKLFLVGQLDRKTYQKVADFIELCGGKWQRGEKAHVFASDPKKFLFALEEGEVIDVKKERQAFYTPLHLVEKVVTMAGVHGKTVLEPSCGDGRFIKECYKQGAKTVFGVDITDEDCKDLNSVVQVCDFLEKENATLYDIVLGNPPYCRTDWLKHTLHAYKFVEIGGKLVFILPNSIYSNKKFQDFVSDKKWTSEKVAAGEFKESGTLIETNIVTIWK